MIVLYLAAGLLAGQSGAVEAPAEVRQPGGWLPIIYVDRHGRRVSLEDAAEVAIEAAPKAQKKAVRAAAKRISEGRDTSAALAEQLAKDYQRLASQLARVDALLAQAMAAKAEEMRLLAEDEEEITLLLMVA